MGIPRSTKLTPEERDALTEKYNMVRGAQVRTQGAADRQQASITAKASGVKSTHVTVGPDGKQSALVVYNNGETDEKPMDATAAVKPRAGGALTPGQGAVQNRFLQRIQQNDTKTHETLQNKEQGLWAQHAALGDVLSTPDGQTFVDPTSKSGKEIQMNYAQRLVFKNRYQAAEAGAKQAQQEASKIRQKYGWGEFSPGADLGDSSPNSAGGASSADAADAPSGPAAAQAARVPGEVHMSPGRSPVSVPGAAAPSGPSTGPTTVRPFKVGQTVYGKDGKPHTVSGYDKTGKVLLD